jgi:hypothetical protein
VPVLRDDRRIYTEPFAGVPVYTNQGITNVSVLAQGSVVYLPMTGLYVYTSWTEFTYEFYESSLPWGPFTLFYRRDFGRYPWSQERAGGYASTIPSKFISEDDGTMYVQSNTFEGGADFYGFSLRLLRLRASRGLAEHCDP